QRRCDHRRKRANRGGAGAEGRLGAGGSGERFASLELNVEVRGVVITADRQQVAAEYVQERIAHAATGITPEQLLADPHWLIRSIEQMVDEVRYLREGYGISYFLVHSEDMEAFAPVVAQLAGQ